MGVPPLCGGTPPLGPVLRFPSRYRGVHQGVAIPRASIFPSRRAPASSPPACRSPHPRGGNRTGKHTPASRSDSEWWGADARSCLFGGRRAEASSGRRITKDESRRGKGGRQGNPANRPRRPTTALSPPGAGDGMAKTFWEKLTRSHRYRLGFGLCCSLPRSRGWHCPPAPRTYFGLPTPTPARKPTRPVTMPRPNPCRRGPRRSGRRTANDLRRFCGESLHAGGFERPFAIHG